MTLRAMFPLLVLVGALAAGAAASGPTDPAFGLPSRIAGYHPEPSLWVAPDGQLLVAAPTGVFVQTAGSEPTIVWRQTSSGAFQDVSPPPFAVGGGDSDLMMAPDGTTVVVDLSAVSITAWTSSDRGSHWSSPFPIASGTLANDRMWLAADENSAYYLIYNQLESGYWGSKSTDGGKTWLPTHIAGAGQYPPGPLVYTSQHVLAFGHGDGPASEVAGIFVGHAGVSPVRVGAAIFVTTSNDHGATWADHLVAETPEWGQNMFPSVAADAAGNLYVLWSEGIVSYHNPIRYAVSTDGGDSWSAPRTLVAAGAGSTMLPWAVAGAAGHLGVAYIKSDRAADNTAGVWHTYYSMTQDALSTTPLVVTTQVSDVPAHVGAITSRPNIGDFLTARAMPDGRAAITWGEDSSGDAIRIVTQTSGTTL
ncbi:MAG: sialidase family protein [Candidatus Thermoplasmatota archaeon]